MYVEIILHFIYNNQKLFMIQKSRHFYFNQYLFYLQMIGRFTIAEDRTRIAVIVFSEITRLEFGLDWLEIYYYFVRSCLFYFNMSYVKRPHWLSFV